MKLGLIISVFFTITLIQCTKVDDRQWRTCLGKDISDRIELLDKSFYISLEKNNLRDIEAFLKMVVNNGDSVYYKFLVPEDAELSVDDINVLRSVLWTKEETYNQYNEFIECLKKCNSCQTELVTGYINDKNAAGNISPVIVADGLLQAAEKEQLNNRLVTDLMLLEIYLPLLKKIGTR